MGVGSDRALGGLQAFGFRRFVESSGTRARSRGCRASSMSTGVLPDWARSRVCAGSHFFHGSCSRVLDHSFGGYLLLGSRSRLPLGRPVRGASCTRVFQSIHLLEVNLSSGA